MTAPLMTRKFNLDPRPLALGNSAAESLDKRLNVCENHRRQSGLGEDRGERLAVASVHGAMMA
jgi:hypothetical protein